MRKLNAWGIDSGALRGLREEHALKAVAIFDWEEKTAYVARAEDFKYGQYLHFKPHRAQVFLKEDFWEKFKVKENLKEEVRGVLR